MTNGCDRQVAAQSRGSLEKFYRKDVNRDWSCRASGCKRQVGTENRGNLTKYEFHIAEPQDVQNVGHHSSNMDEPSTSTDGLFLNLDRLDAVGTYMDQHPDMDPFLTSVAESSDSSSIRGLCVTWVSSAALYYYLAAGIHVHAWISAASFTVYTCI